MPNSQIFTIIISVISAIISGVLVAVINNYLQKHREELKVLREKGEVMIHRINSTNDKLFKLSNLRKEKMGTRAMEAANEIMSADAEISALSYIYFPKCETYYHLYRIHTILYCERIISTAISGNYSSYPDNVYASISDEDVKDRYLAAMYGFIEKIVSQIHKIKMPDEVKFQLRKREIAKKNQRFWLRRPWHWLQRLRF